MQQLEGIKVYVVSTDTSRMTLLKQYLDHHKITYTLWTNTASSGRSQGDPGREAARCLGSKAAKASYGEETSTWCKKFCTRPMIDSASAHIKLWAHLATQQQESSVLTHQYFLVLGCNIRSIDIPMLVKHIKTLKKLSLQNNTGIINLSRNILPKEIFKPIDGLEYSTGYFHSLNAYFLSNKAASSLIKHISTINYRIDFMINTIPLTHYSIDKPKMVVAETQVKQNNFIPYNSLRTPILKIGRIVITLGLLVCMLVLPFLLFYGVSPFILFFYGCIFMSVLDLE